RRNPSAPCSSRAPRPAPLPSLTSRSGASGFPADATRSSGSPRRRRSTCCAARSGGCRARPREGLPVPRSFVALVLGEETRAAVAAEIERLRPLSEAVAWVPAANLHITVKFLGNQPDDRLADATDGLAEASALVAPFNLAFHGVGGFPGMERPRILWVGVAEGALAARALQERIEAALERRSFPRETRAWH